MKRKPVNLAVKLLTRRRCTTPYTTRQWAFSKTTITFNAIVDDCLV
jgi:hypothetical protein